MRELNDGSMARANYRRCVAWVQREAMTATFIYSVATEPLILIKPQTTEVRLRMACYDATRDRMRARRRVVLASWQRVLMTPRFTKRVVCEIAWSCIETQNPSLVRLRVDERAIEVV